MTATAPTLALQDSFDKLDTTLNDLMVERQREIRAAILAVLARRHVFLLGSPGIGKSYLIDLLKELISGTKSFSVLMSRFTTPPEVFGPVSLSGLKHDQFIRKINGYLPTADIAFIDEIFKANSSILNSLLWAMNERKYRHDEKVIDIDLSTLFCASNELPQGEELGALYDRIDVRIEVKPIKDAQKFKQMLRLTDAPRTPVLTWEEVVRAQEEVKAVTIGEPVLDALVELRRQLKTEGIEPTDRRFRSSLALVRASAWLDGRTDADQEDLTPLQHVMWDRPEQIADVDKVVLSIASPLDRECNDLIAEIDKLEMRLDQISTDDDKHRKGTEIHNKLKKAKLDLDDIEKRAGKSRRRAVLTKDVRARLLSVTQRVLKEIFNLNPEEYMRNGGI